MAHQNFDSNFTNIIKNWLPSFKCQNTARHHTEWHHIHPKINFTPQSIRFNASAMPWKYTIQHPTKHTFLASYLKEREPNGYIRFKNPKKIKPKLNSVCDSANECQPARALAPSAWPRPYPCRVVFVCLQRCRTFVYWGGRGRGLAGDWRG